MQCSGCNIAVYCNATCQKNHWQTHKPICKASRSTPVTTTQHSREIRQALSPVTPGQPLTGLSGVPCRSCHQIFTLDSGLVHSVITRASRLSFSCIPCLTKVPGVVIPPNCVCTTPICQCCMHISDLNAPITAQEANSTMDHMNFRCQRCVRTCPVSGPCKLHLRF
jgi:hypothetical protein